MNVRLIVISFLTLAWPYASILAGTMSGPVETRSSCNCGCVVGKCRCCCSKGSSDSSQPRPIRSNLCTCDTDVVPTLAPAQAPLPRLRKLSGVTPSIDFRAEITQPVLAESWARAHSPPPQRLPLSTLLLLI